jgi:hypothetical protein
MMKRAERRAWAALPGAEGPGGLPSDGPVIHTGRLFAACAGTARQGPRGCPVSSAARAGDTA